MSLLDIVRSAVKIADTVTKDLQATVSYRRYVSSDFMGAVTPASPVDLRAIIDGKQQQIRTTSGILSVSRAIITFLDIDALVAATNGEGISDKDVIVLPDGTTGPILALSGFVDSGTGHPIATEAFIG